MRMSVIRRRLADAHQRALTSLRRIRRIRSLAALAAVAAILTWSALSVVNAFGTVDATRTAKSASSAQYEYTIFFTSVETAIKDAQTDQPVTEAPVGASVYDTATVFADETPPGSVTFQRFSTPNCMGSHQDEEVALVNGAARSSTTTVPSTGLSYKVVYGGATDGFNTWQSSTSGCESLSPLPATFSLTGSGTIAGVGQVSFDISFRVTGSAVTGTCSITEPRTRTKIKCLTVSSAALSDGGTTATITGTANVNGTTRTFTIVAHDAGTPGVGADTFSITAGSFSRSGTLTSGNLTIHS